MPWQHDIKLFPLHLLDNWYLVCRVLSTDWNTLQHLKHFTSNLRLLYSMKFMPQVQHNAIEKWKPTCEASGRLQLDISNVLLNELVSVPLMLVRRDWFALSGSIDLFLSNDLVPTVGTISQNLDPIIGSCVWSKMKSIVRPVNNQRQNILSWRKSRSVHKHSLNSICLTRHDR